MNTSEEPQVLWREQKENLCVQTAKNSDIIFLVVPLVSFLFSCFGVKHVVYTHPCVNFSGVIPDTGQALCKQGGQSWASESVEHVSIVALYSSHHLAEGDSAF